MADALNPTFIYANYAEACLWAALAVAAVIKRSGNASWLLATALLLFGLSDVVETRTGAWYKPWWLFAWKAICVLCILIFGIAAWRRRRGSTGPETRASDPS
jgi:hypothetical protein